MGNHSNYPCEVWHGLHKIIYGRCFAWPQKCNHSIHINCGAVLNYGVDVVAKVLSSEQDL